MRHTVAKLQELLGPVVTAMGYELLGVELHPRPGGALLRVYIDKEDGVDLDDCQRVSHQLSGILDVEDPISGRYTLEVSSPGLDRPLFTAQHFARFTGHQVRVHLAAPLHGRKTLTARLRGMRDNCVVLEHEGQELLAPLTEVVKARLIPEF